jgi:RNA polymerase sigma-70 factor (ECF subfamily)
MSHLRDPAAFAAAYRRLAPVATATALAVLHDEPAAEDVAQDVFLALWARPETFRPERGSLASFIRLLARSRALDRRRTRIARTAAMGRVADATPATSAAPAWEPVLRRDGARRMLGIVDELPEGQRTALLLHHVCGLSDRELADAMHLPLGTAKSRIRAGNVRLRGALESRLAA